MTDQPKYGSKGQEWHPNFIKYIEFIANHKIYEGMPDTFVDGGKIQWEAPSNRVSGRYKDTHHKRREWWRKKAISIGIDINSSQWISRTARLIHPTKQKPCKRCGRVMELRYAYPSNSLIKRIQKLSYVDDTFPLILFEDIISLITRLVEKFGETVFSDLPTILKTTAISPPALEPKLENWLQWLEEVYIPSEPSVLSPGAMSNAPDRFDGFHSFNQCCRGVADKGRNKSNLQSYTTDRRVFEYWAEGNWIAADRLMGQVRAIFSNESCLNGHPGPCSADHIGPISLGFTHRPEFQLLCKSCNSAKNNRMTLRDVVHLRMVEAAGEKIISWHSQDLWNARKLDVVDDETALRLSKLLRDNRHTLMSILQNFKDAGYFTFLASFLELQYAEYDVDFVNLRVENHVTVFDKINQNYRTTKYTEEQKARRARIAFQSLRDYFTKENRNAFVISTQEIKNKVETVLSALQNSSNTIKQLDQQIAAILAKESETTIDEEFRSIVSNLPSCESPEFIAVKQELRNAMALVAQELNNLWDSERYVRSEPGEALVEAVVKVKTEKKIANHYTPRLSQLDLMMVRAVPPGGNWKNIPESIPSKRLEQIRISFAAGMGSRSTYYGRLKPDVPSYTISTYFNRPGNGCHIHYDYEGGQHRVISQREAARLQSFPDNFVFYGSRTAVNEQIGNAVPPMLAYQIALHLGQPGLFVDLFAGAGGLALGFTYAGWQSVIANDVMASALETYANNIDGSVVLGDIRNEEVFSQIVSAAQAARKANPNLKLFVVGGPPCQGFSTAGKARTMSDERNSLFQNYRQIVEAIRPDGFVFENVMGLLNIEKGRVFNLVHTALSSITDKLSIWKLDAENYGVPQRRKRLILVGRMGESQDIPPPPHICASTGETLLVLPAPITVSEALSDLPPLQPGQDGENLDYATPPLTDYQRLMRGIISPSEYLEKLRQK
jgi:Alw26I/Eco31I/Esp3I family type II restriction endonuclease